MHQPANQITPNTYLTRHTRLPTTTTTRFPRALHATFFCNHRDRKNNSCQHDDRLLVVVILGSYQLESFAALDEWATKKPTFFVGQPRAFAPWHVPRDRNGDDTSSYTVTAHLQQQPQASQNKRPKSRSRDSVQLSDSNVSCGASPQGANVCPNGIRMGRALWYDHS